MMRTFFPLLLRIVAFSLTVWLYLRRDTLAVTLLDRIDNVGFLHILVPAWQQAIQFITSYFLYLVLILLLSAGVITIRLKKMSVYIPVLWLPLLFRRIEELLCYLALLRFHEERKIPIDFRQLAAPPDLFPRWVLFLNAFYVSVAVLFGTLVTGLILYSGAFTVILWSAKTLQSYNLISPDAFKEGEVIGLSILVMYAMLLEGTLLWYKVRDYYVMERLHRKQRWLY